MSPRIAVVRRPARRTHLSNASVEGTFQTLCNRYVPARDAHGVTLDITGGATERFMGDLKREFNDDTCCLDCSRLALMVAICYTFRNVSA